MIPTLAPLAAAPESTVADLAPAAADFTPAAAATSATDGGGGFVWVLLFAFAMILSIAANSLLAALSGYKADGSGGRGVLGLLLAMFGVNVVEYALLCFEFSLGLAQIFPYGSAACAAYQAALKVTPLAQSAILLVMLAQASSRSLRWPLVSATGALLAASCVPTALFARLTEVESGAGFRCEVDPLGGVSGASVVARQKAASAFYLVYSAVIPYWLPLVVSLPLLYRLRFSPAAQQPQRQQPASSSSASSAASKNRGEDASLIVLATVVSFLSFHLLHALIVTARHSMDLAQIRVTPYQSWIMKVVQSLFWLFAYFWHFSRASLAILLDPELKSALSQTKICRFLELEEEERPQEVTPLCIVVSKEEENNENLV